MFDAHDVAGGGPIVDRLLCESDFLHVEGAGTTDNLTAKFSFSLNQLADQLGQFVDFGEHAIRRRRLGQSHLETLGRPAVRRRRRRRNFAASSWRWPKQPPWREDSVLLSASAKGQTNFDANTRIDAATLSVKSGSDQIDAKILEPVKDMQGGGVWPVWRADAGPVAELARPPGRLVAAMNNVQLAGGYIVEADGVASKDGGELRQMGFAAEPLIVKSPLVEHQRDADRGRRGRLVEPAAAASATPVGLDCSCATAAVGMPRTSSWRCPPTGRWNWPARSTIRATPAGFGSGSPIPKLPSPWRLAGQLKGSAALQQTAGVVHGATTTELANLAVVDSAGKQFQEPIVRLVAQGDYDSQSKTLQLSQCELTSSALTAAAGGRLAPVSGQENGQLEGKLNYDLERLTGLLRPCLGPNIRIAGRGSIVGVVSRAVLAGRRIGRRGVPLGRRQPVRFPARTGRHQGHDGQRRRADRAARSGRRRRQGSLGAARCGLRRIRWC